MRGLFAPLRLLGIVALLVVALAIATLVFPWLRQPTRNRIIGGWSRLLLAVCGLRLHVTGTLPAELARTGMQAGRAGRLLLVNHVSWIDIFALNAALPTRFVAKSEIGRWPLLGALVTLAGTLYIERGRRHAVHATNQHVRERIAAGESVAVFPEGTTSDGTRLLAFHSNLIAPALEQRCEVWPVALRYAQHGRLSQVPAYVGDMTLVQSIWKIVSARALVVEVAFLPPLVADACATRHQLAAAARTAIARHLGLPEQTPAGSD